MCVCVKLTWLKCICQSIDDHHQDASSLTIIRIDLHCWAYHIFRRYVWLTCQRFQLIILFVYVSFHLAKPKLLELPKKTELVANMTHIFQCNLLAGTQPVTFEWHRDGQPILSSDDNRLKIDSSMKTFSSLSIHMLRPTDAGGYTCRATNAFGSDSSFTVLLVSGLICFL